MLPGNIFVDKSARAPRIQMKQMKNQKNDKQGTETHRKPPREKAIAKGYRLKQQTHFLVEKLTKQINGTKEEVINRACKMFESSIECKKHKQRNK